MSERGKVTEGMVKKGGINEGEDVPRPPAPKGSKPDMINHPPHYNMGKHEVIDVLWNWKLPFCLANATKYIARAEHKGYAIQDLEKAIFYIDYERAKTDPPREEPLSHTEFADMLPIREVIDDWKLSRHCGDALWAIFTAVHKCNPHSYLGLASAHLAAEIDELRRKL